MSTQEIGALIDSVNEMTATVAGKMGEIDQSLQAAEQKMDNFITQARNEYIRFIHYVPFDTKVVIPALGLSRADIDNYIYSQTENYQPQNESGNACFADIQEFANGFNVLPIPEGMSVYIHLLVNVVGSVNWQTTTIHMLRYEEGQLGYHAHQDPTKPFTLDGESGRAFDITARDWHDNYQSRAELKTVNFNDRNGYGHSRLRILNLGSNPLEIFGIGVEIRA